MGVMGRPLVFRAPSASARVRLGAPTMKLHVVLFRNSAFFLGRHGFPHTGYGLCFTVYVLFVEDVVCLMYAFAQLISKCSG